MYSNEDADRYLADREEWLERLPICDECGEHIQDEYFYEIPKFGRICEKCLERFLVWNDSLE